MKKIILFIKKPQVIIFFVFFLALLLRIYNLSQRYVFSADEEYQVNIAMSLVKNFHLIWIGVNASNTGFYLGPFWSYFTAFWLFLSHGDPLITAYVAAFLGSLTAVVIFYVGWKMFSLRVGTIASFLYSCLPLIVFFDQKYWNPSIIPLLSVVMVYSLYKVKENQNYWLLFSLAYGLVFHIHLSLVPFILLAIYALRRGVKKDVLIKSLIIFLLTISPLIVFDYFHKWSNITTPFRFNQINSLPHPSLIEKGNVFSEALSRLWYLPTYSINANEVLSACSNYKSPSSLLAAPFLIILFIFLFNEKTWSKDNSKILSLGILLISLSYLLFPGGKDEYYLLGLFPLLLFVPGIIWHKDISPILIGIVCILGIMSVLTAYNPYGLAAKKQIISQVISEIGNESYELSEKGECHKFEGWRYLFATYGRRPERSDVDSVFGWLYPEEISNKPAKYSVVVRGYDTGELGISYDVIDIGKTDQQ